MEFTGALRQSGSQSPGERIRVKMTPKMDEPNEKPRRYRWPWFVLAAFLLAVALAIVWMSFAVHREKQERDVNAPLPAVPAR